MKKIIKITGFLEGILKVVNLFLILIILLSIIAAVTGAEITSSEKSISGLITMIFAYITSIKIEVKEE